MMPEEIRKEFEQRGFQIVNGYMKPFSFVYRDNIVVSPNTSKDVQPTTNYVHHIEYPEYTGIKSFMTDSDFKILEYYFSGQMPDPIDWFFLNQAKKLLLEFTKNWKCFILPFIFSWDKVKYVEKLMFSYNQITLSGMKHLFIVPKYMTPPAYEIEIALKDFLTQIGINKEIAENFSVIFAHFIEYDNAYRLRIQDILSETSKEFIINDPMLEVDRLFLIMRDRDLPGMYNKIRKFKYIFESLLIFPKYKKAFIDTIANMNLESMKYTEADRYWASKRTDYKSFGMELEDRLKMYEE